MVEIKLTTKGFMLSHELPPNLLISNFTGILQVACEDKYYGTDKELMNNACAYLSSFLTDDLEVNTKYAVVSIKMEENTKGKFINNICFQIYI